jgi:hypothetical protein
MTFAAVSKADMPVVENIALKRVGTSDGGADADVGQVEDVQVTDTVPASIPSVATNDLPVFQVQKTFGTLSTLSLAVSLMATWETICSTIGSGLVSGGPVSLIYGFIRMNGTRNIAKSLVPVRILTFSQCLSLVTSVRRCRWVS